jgi:murein L,D-transpeptidase YafK
MKILIFTILLTLHISMTEKPSKTVIPSSARSQQSIAKVRPLLERDLGAKRLRYGSPIFIRIFKESNELELWIKGARDYELFRTYKICFYSGRLGPKQRQGDLQSPEGFYTVRPAQMNPNSKFHLSFNIGYPNPYDRAYRRTGDFIMIHGNCVSIGCYAMTDEKIEEIYALADAALRGGQPFFPVHIFPFRMTEDNLKRYRNSEWIDFWLNLKEGYDYFEEKKIPPGVRVQQRRYIFSL